MALIYNIGLRLYQLAIFIASFFNEKARKLRKGQAASFDMLKSKTNPKDEYIWFHAASLGEFEQGRPVIEKIKQTQPDSKILLTFFSPSGYEIRKNYPMADVVCYLPLDTKRHAQNWLNTVTISKAIFIKYEFWPNYLTLLKKRNIPFYSISAIFRTNQLFFKNYGKWYLSILKSFTHIFVQDKDSAHLLQSYHINNTTVAGDTRFDRVTDLSLQAKQIPIVEAFVKDAHQIIVAGSSWPKDEELLIKYLNEHPQTKLILVPHETHETHITNIISLLKGKCIRYTHANPTTVLQQNCLIVDTIGLLSSIYQYANVAYIGGGFGVGIHNTLEAAVWNVPVVFGPKFEKFREARELISIKGGYSIANYEELKVLFNSLMIDKKAGQIAGNYVKENTGATDLIIQAINA